MHGYRSHEYRRQVVYFYFDFNDQTKQEVAGFLRSILAQLTSRDLNSFATAEWLYSQADSGKEQASRDDLCVALLSMLKQRQVYLIVDALDECCQRDEMLDILLRISTECSEMTNILITSREERDIILVLDKIASKNVQIQNTLVDADIRTYVASCLTNNRKLRTWPEPTKKEIEDAMAKGAQGM
jgi:hypothetical protein